MLRTFRPPSWTSLTRTLRTLQFFSVAALIAALSILSLVYSAQADQRPNIVLIITDDQRYDTMGSFMPLTQAKLFDQGVTFDHAYVTTPACCPSRSSIFTGMYAHHHKVRLNQDKLFQTTFMERLSQAGYYTGISGKYLNSWNGTPRPEFNFWSVFRFGEAKYYNPILNVQGVKAYHQGYLTDLLKDEALSFLDQAAAQPNPFLLVFTPFSPHAPSDPAAEDRRAFEGLGRFRPPNYGAKDLAGKPAWLRSRAQLTQKRLLKIDDFRIRQLRTNLAVDRAVDALLQRLTQLGVIDNTLVIFLSDNGVLWGEHGMTSKDCVYEPAIHVPFAVRYPALTGAPRIESRQIANIDIAPTIYELAGLPVPENVDGRSLVSLLNNSAQSWRDTILIEGWRRDENRRPFRALHSSDFVYVESEGGEPELYDLKLDPYEITNLASRAPYSQLVRVMRRRLVDDFGRPHFKDAAYWHRRAIVAKRSKLLGRESNDIR